MSINIMKRFGFGSDMSREDASLTLGSGPGAPIFEPGPQPRIRRAPVRSIATLSWNYGKREVFGQVVNISPGGCLVKTEATIEAGTAIEMSITVLGNGRRTTVDVAGVVRRETTADGRRAYGVEFSPRDRADRETLECLYAEALR